MVTGNYPHILMCIHSIHNYSFSQGSCFSYLWFQNGTCLFFLNAVCTQCSKKNLHGRCPVHGLPCFIQDKQTSGRHAGNARQLKAPDNYAVWTTPDCLEVAPSGISGAGYGVWTRQTFLKGTMFGPYRGKKVYEERVAHNSSYAWEVNSEIFNCIN